MTNNIWILPGQNQNYTHLLINLTKDKERLDASLIHFSIRYILFQTGMVEHVKFYSKTNTDFYNVLKMIFSYDKQLICQTIIIVFFILLDRILNSDCIVNNGNILTDGRWRCYYEMGQRICHRNALQKRFKRSIKYEQLIYFNLFFIETNSILYNHLLFCNKTSP